MPVRDLNITIPEHTEQQLLGYIEGYGAGTISDPDEKTLYQLIQNCPACADTVESESFASVFDFNDPNHGTLTHLFIIRNTNSPNRPAATRDIPQGKIRVIKFNKITHEYSKVDDYEEFVEARAIKTLTQEREENDNIKYFILEHGESPYHAHY